MAVIHMKISSSFLNCCSSVDYSIIVMKIIRSRVLCMYVYVLLTVSVPVCVCVVYKYVFSY